MAVMAVMAVVVVVVVVVVTLSRYDVNCSPGECSGVTIIFVRVYAASGCLVIHARPSCAQDK